MWQSENIQKYVIILIGSDNHYSLTSVKGNDYLQMKEEADTFQGERNGKTVGVMALESNTCIYRSLFSSPKKG